MQYQGRLHKTKESLQGWRPSALPKPSPSFVIFCPSLLSLGNSLKNQTQRPPFFLGPNSKLSSLFPTLPNQPIILLTEWKTENHLLCSFSPFIHHLANPVVCLEMPFYSQRKRSIRVAVQCRKIMAWRQPGGGKKRLVASRVFAGASWRLCGSRVWRCYQVWR